MTEPMANRPTPPEREQQVATPDRRSWSKWIKGGLVVAVIGALIVIQWPMLKGIAYGIAPPEKAPADQLPQWRPGYEAALAESEQTGKPVLIDFTASWCPPCRVMEADVWPDEDVRTTIAERVVPLQLDVDVPTSAAAAQRYGIQYIPMIMLVDAEGNEIARGGFMSADAVVEFISTHAPQPTGTSH